MPVEILALNPAARKRGKRKGRKKTMSKRRRGGAGRGRDSKGRFLKRGGGKRGGRSRKTAIVRWNPGEEFMLPNENPSVAGQAVRHYARRGYTAGRGLIAGLGVGAALRSQIPMLAGALGTRIVQKKWGEKDYEADWDMKDYMLALLGAFGTGLLVKHVFKASPATSQKVLEGGIFLVGYKALNDQVIAKSDTLKDWLAEDEDTQGAIPEDEGSWEGGEAAYQPGDIYMGEDGGQYVYGADGYWRPANEAHRRPDILGDVVSPPGHLGDAPLSPPGHLGADPYVDAYANKAGASVW